MITPCGDTLWFPGDTITLPWGNGHGHPWGGGGNSWDTTFVATDTMITPWGDTLWLPGDTITLPWGNGHGHHGHGHHGHHGHPNDTCQAGSSSENAVVTKDESSFAMIEDVNVYPNPVVNQITLEYTSDISDYANIKIFGMNGKMVYSNTELIAPGRNSIKCNVSQIPPGIYILQISNSISKHDMKFVK